MKKRIVCMLMLLAMVASLVPLSATAVSAAEPVKYEELYVKDGLQNLYMAFAGDTGDANAAAGTWRPRFGTADITLAGGDTWWKPGKNGGVGYTMTPEQWKTDAKNVGIHFPDGTLPLEDYTVQMVYTATGVTTESGDRYIDDIQAYGFYQKNLISYRLGGLGGMQFEGSTDGSSMRIRWSYWEQGTWEDSGKYWAGTHDDYVLQNAKFNAAVAYTILHDHSAPSDGKTYPHSAYTMYSGIGESYSFDNYTTKREDCQTWVDPRGIPFQLAVGFPTTVFAIRIYDRVLTDEERYQNNFADLCAYFRLEMSAFAALPDHLKQRAFRDFALYDFTAEPSELQKKLDELGQVADLGPMPTLEDTLYVTDGLKVWLDATDKASVANTVDLVSGRWYNKAADNYATLLGAPTNWLLGKEQGFGFRLGKKNLVSGLDIGFDKLPDGAYTLELLMDPIGLTNEDGSELVFSKDLSYGIEAGTGSAIGPLKAETFPAKAPEGVTACSHENRWFYFADGDWLDYGAVNGWGTLLTDHTWQSDCTMGYTIRMSESEKTGTAVQYDFYNNRTRHASASVLSKDYAPKDACDERFYLARSFPMDFYSVRVYDRALTEDELSQNHTADLVYYYDIDVSFYKALRQMLPQEDIVRFHHEFDNVDFSMSREEAQTLFNNRMTGIWLESAGVAVRLDNTIGLRAEFLLQEEAVATMEKQGYRLELGALLSIGDSYPTLQSHQHRMVARQADGTCNESLFLEDGRFALAVLIGNPTKELCVKDCLFSGYVSITDAQGNTRTVYYPVEVSAFRTNIFAAYDYQLSNGYDSNGFVKKTVDGCYLDHALYVDPARGSDGNSGSADAPLSTLRQALLQVKELLDNTAPVSITVHLAEGKHYATQALSLDRGEGMGRYSRVTLVGEGEGAVITGEVPLDSSYFNESAGIYDFWMEDALGEIPDFRFLYVNGEQATLAHQGNIREDAGSQYECSYEFERLDNGSYRVYLDREALLPLRGVEDVRCELHIRVEWEYKILHIVDIDWADTQGEDNEFVACYLEPAEMNRYSSVLSNWKGRDYWLANHLAFVDEPGEYYYNRQEGSLYWYPEESQTPENTEVSFGGLETLMTFKGMQNLTLENLIFTGTDNHTGVDDGYIGSQAGYEKNGGSSLTAAVYAEGCRNFTVTGCTFRQIAGDGVFCDGDLFGLKLLSNRFLGVGMSAIHVGSSGSSSTRCENTLISDNYLDDTGTYYKNCPAMLIHHGKDMEVSYNTILNSSYTAISIGWGWSSVNTDPSQVETRYNLLRVSVAYNYINNFMTDMDDGGAIYTLGGNVSTTYTDPLNELTQNLVVCGNRTGDDPEGKGNRVMPYYHDGASSHWHDYGNVLVVNPRYIFPRLYFLQGLSGQETYHITLEETYIVNYVLPKVSTDPEYNKLNGIFGFGTIFNIPGTCYVDPARGHSETRTVVLESWEEMLDNPSLAEVMSICGSMHRLPTEEDLSELPTADTYTPPSE